MCPHQPGVSPLAVARGETEEPGGITLMNVTTYAEDVTQPGSTDICGWLEQWIMAVHE